MGVLILVKPILLTSRYEFISYSALCSGIDLLDPEARVDWILAVLFLMVESISWTPRHEFVSYSALPSVESIFLTPRHKFIFYSGSLSDIQTPGLLSFCSRYIDIFL